MAESRSCSLKQRTGAVRLPGRHRYPDAAKCSRRPLAVEYLRHERRRVCAGSERDDRYQDPACPAAVPQDQQGRCCSAAFPSHAGQDDPGFDCLRGTLAAAGCSGGSSAGSPSAVPPSAATPTADSTPAGSACQFTERHFLGEQFRGLQRGPEPARQPGDLYKQAYTFGSPEAEANVPDAVNGVQTCQLGVANPARNLVVPVQVTTTLTTSVQTRIPVELEVTDYTRPGPNAGVPGVAALPDDGWRPVRNQSARR